MTKSPKKDIKPTYINVVQWLFHGENFGNLLASSIPDSDKWKPFSLVLCY